MDSPCAICQETLHSSSVYHLPCGHSFHTHCIEQQLQAGAQWSNLCALCRTCHHNAFRQIPQLRAIQNNNNRRRVESIFIAAVGFDSMSQGGETPPFILYGNDNVGWRVIQGPEPAAGPADNETVQIGIPVGPEYTMAAGPDDTTAAADNVSQETASVPSLSQWEEEYILQTPEIVSDIGSEDWSMDDEAYELSESYNPYPHGFYQWSQEQMDQS